VDDLESAQKVFDEVTDFQLQAWLENNCRLEIKSPKANRAKLLFKLPMGFDARLKQFKHKGAVIFELRCGNCQDVIYGQHPEGGNYQLIGDPAKIPDAPAVFLDMLQHWEDWKPCFESALGIEQTPLKIKPRTPEQCNNLPGRRDPIDEFNQSKCVTDVLIRNGYKQSSKDRFIRPGSTSKAPGVVILRNCADGIERVFSHGGDVLNDGYAHDPFDLMRLLECGGNWATALSWNPEITKLNQELFRQEKAAKHQQPSELSPSQSTYQEPQSDNDKVKPVRTATVEPFYGFMSEIVEAALKDAHKPQPELTILAVLIGMSSACTGEYVLPGGGRLNLYGTGVAGTGGGKDHPRCVAELIAGAGCCHVIGQPASGEGLEDLLESNKNIFISIDETAHLMEAINGSNKPPYLITLAGNLLKLFTASKGIYRTRALAKAKANSESARAIYNPCVNMLGFATPEKLGKAVSIANIEDGLLGRNLFAMGSDGVPPKRVKFQFLLSYAVIERARKIGNSNRNVHISMASDANILLDELLISFDTNALSATTSFERALKMRSFEKCERIAGVLAVWEDPEKPLVNVDHVKWAASFVMYSDNTVIRFCADFMHGGEVQSHAALIIKTMMRVLAGELVPSKAKEVAHIKLGRLPWAFGLKASRLSKKEFDDAVNYLIDLGEVEIMMIEAKGMNGQQYKSKFLLRL
jgi:hypothetical protein